MTGVVVWLTGRPASGKSTLAHQIKARLDRRGVPACILDSDEIRTALGDQDYSSEGRDRFYASLAELASLLATQGVAVLVAATAHRAAYRDAARYSAPRFVEVYVATPAEECAKRDPKSLYRGAAIGDVSSLPGTQVAYEEPIAPDVTASGGFDDEATDAVVRQILAAREARPEPRSQRWN